MLNKYFNERINDDEDAETLVEHFEEQSTHRDNSEDRESILSRVKDKFLIIWAILFLYGVSALLPWNIFITANDYFVNEKLNTSVSFNSTYRNKFTFITAIIGQTTNLIVIFLCTFFPILGNLQKKIPYTVLVAALLILFQMILAIIDTSEWPLGFFIICCLSVLILYIATGIMNSCIFYTASIFPMEYTNAVVVGTNFSGLFTVVCSIISKATTSNLRLAAILYFLSGFIVLCITLCGYFIMSKLEFYKYWYNVYQENKRKAAEINNSEVVEKVPYKKIFKRVIFLYYILNNESKINYL